MPSLNTFWPVDAEMTFFGHRSSLLPPSIVAKPTDSVVLEAALSEEVPISMNGRLRQCIRAGHARSLFRQTPLFLFTHIITQALKPMATSRPIKHRDGGYNLYR